MTTQQLGGPQTEEVFFDDIDSVILDQNKETVGTGEPENVTIYGGEEATLGDQTGEADEVGWQEPIVPSLDYIPPAPPPPPQPSQTEYELHETLMAERKAAMNERLNASVNQQSAEVAQAFYQHLIENEGYDRAQAKDMTESQVGIYHQALTNTIKDHIQKRTLDNKAKVIVAQRIGQAFSVNPNMLMMFDSPEKMYQGAVQFASGVHSTRAENYRLRQENQTMRRGRVPVQRYDRGGRVRGGSNDDQLIDQYNNGIENAQTLAAVKKRYGI